MPPEVTLWLLLAVYALGILWVLGLLYVTLMKFAGVMRIERPGWLFGSKVTSEFNHINGIELIARAHQLVQEGYIHWFKVQVRLFRTKIW